MALYEDETKMAQPASEAHKLSLRKFKEYLQSNGVTEALKNALLKLYTSEPRQDNPLNYLRNVIGDSDEKKSQIDSLYSNVKRLEEQNDSLFSNAKRLEEQNAILMTQNAGLAELKGIISKFTGELQAEQQEMKNDQEMELSSTTQQQQPQTTENLPIEMEIQMQIQNDDFSAVCNSPIPSSNADLKGSNFENSLFKTEIENASIKAENVKATDVPSAIQSGPVNGDHDQHVPVANEFDVADDMPETSAEKVDSVHDSDQIDSISTSEPQNMFSSENIASAEDGVDCEMPTIVDAIAVETPTESKSPQPETTVDENLTQESPVASSECIDEEHRSPITDEPNPNSQADASTISSSSVDDNSKIDSTGDIDVCPLQAALEYELPDDENDLGCSPIPNSQATSNDAPDIEAMNIEQIQSTPAESVALPVCQSSTLSATETVSFPSETIGSASETESASVDESQQSASVSESQQSASVNESQQSASIIDSQPPPSVDCPGAVQTANNEESVLQFADDSAIGVQRQDTLNDIEQMIAQDSISMQFNSSQIISIGYTSSGSEVLTLNVPVTDLSAGSLLSDIGDERDYLLPSTSSSMNSFAERMDTSTMPMSNLENVCNLEERNKRKLSLPDDYETEHLLCKSRKP